MTPSCPLHRSDLLASQLENELVLFDEAEEVVHVLNTTAKLVWELCDAHHTIDDMAQALRAQFAIPSDRDVLADVTETLALFSAKGLLQSPKRLVTPAEPDARPAEDNSSMPEKGASPHEPEGTPADRDPQ